MGCIARPLRLICLFVLWVSPVYAGKLSIVIDDVGYRPHEENAVLQMPLAITVAVLPHAPHAHLMATKAHQQGREVLIHLPMAPLSKQPLERDTLQPSMSREEVQRIIRNAVNNVPYAVGINNHMGSAMTSSLSGMQKVMQTLAGYRLYFLDSVTIGNTQASNAAIGTGVKVIKRNVFLDDSADPDDIRRQFDRAVNLARRNGIAIAIGHPRPATVKVLQQRLATLPSDIVLVAPSTLLDNVAAQGIHSPAVNKSLQLARNANNAMKQCKIVFPVKSMGAKTVLHIIMTSVADSILAKELVKYW